MMLGATLVGPHRDDLSIFINKQEARSFASQGQLRSAIAGLRLAQWKHLKDHHGTAPLFCIDDFGVHLDSVRRAALLESLTSFGQVFLTSPAFLETSSHQVLDVESGVIQKSLS
jgi:DNA replication and repair protein RecF